MTRCVLEGGEAVLGQGHVEAATVCGAALLCRRADGDELVDQPGGVG
jgi:hypothetical protein